MRGIYQQSAAPSEQARPPCLDRRTTGRWEILDTWLI